MNLSSIPTILDEKLGDLPCLRIRTDAAEALIARQGGQVLRYQQRGKEPLVWLSEKAVFTEGKSVRGGAPVCWPWFGDLRRSPAAVQAMYQGAEPPFHGMVRTLDWELEEPVVDGDQVIVTLRLPLPDGLPGWPHAAEVCVRVTVGETLDTALITHNHSDVPIALTQALHTYFAVSDIHQVSLKGFDGTRYLDALDGWQEKPQEGDITFTEETDRVYLGVGDEVSIEDPGWQRRIVLQRRGSASAIVWNPWIAKTARMSDLAEDAWERMLCIETARMGEADALVIAPGASHEMGVTLRREDL